MLAHLRIYSPRPFDRIIDERAARDDKGGSERFIWREITLLFLRTGQRTGVVLDFGTGTKREDNIMVIVDDVLREAGFTDSAICDVKAGRRVHYGGSLDPASDRELSVKLAFHVRAKLGRARDIFLNSPKKKEYDPAVESLGEPIGSFFFHPPFGRLRLARCIRPWYNNVSCPCFFFIFLPFATARDDCRGWRNGLVGRF